MRCSLWLLLLFLALLSPAAAAQDPDLALDRILTELEISAGGVETLASDFVQEKQLAMFRETLLSKGR
ncbi:MAG: hypothetical protein P8X63_05430, partial [Desulfuromonadaceae bacterium]